LLKAECDIILGKREFSDNTPTKIINLLRITAKPA
jgi:hypothetical protein